MSNSKISALTSATTPLAGTEVLPIVQSSTTKQVSVANLTAGRTQTSNGIVQGAAATGYNFTANTPAAGKTSQLLNWYEEGTWTPVASGTWTTTPTIYGTARYTRVGRQVTLTFAFQNGVLSVNTNGYFTGLPFTPVDVGTGAVVDNNIVNRGLCEAAVAGRIWVTNTLFPDVNFISITYFV